MSRARPFVLLWVGGGVATAVLFGLYRYWDTSVRPLSPKELSTATPERIAAGLGDVSRSDAAASRLLTEGKHGWDVLVTSLSASNQATRLAAARALSTIRVPELEGGILKSIDETDPQVQDAKVAALAANGTVKSMATLNEYFFSRSRSGGRGVTFATIPFATLAASVGSRSSIPALEERANVTFEASVRAIADIDLDEARRFGERNWATLQPSGRFRLATLIPGLATIAGEPLLDEYARALVGSENNLDAADPRASLDLLRLYGLANVQPGSRAWPHIMALVTKTDPGMAAVFSFTNPQPSVAAFFAARTATTTHWYEPGDVACVAAINGDRSVALPKPVASVQYILAAISRGDRSALPLLRPLLSRSNLPQGFGSLAALGLARISEDREDRNLAFRYLLENKARDFWMVEAALSFGDGEKMLRREIEEIDIKTEAGQTFVRLLCQCPGMRKREDLQRLVVAKCTAIPFFNVSNLDPDWCRRLGDDELKAKYAQKLQGYRYFGRVDDLVALGQSGFAQTLDVLAQTVRRGLIDETITCIEVAAENEMPGDRLGFVMQFAGDKRWRVREAVAYALRRLATPKALDALAPLKSDPVPLVRTTSTMPTGYDSHHFVVSPRQPVRGLPVPRPATSVAVADGNPHIQQN